MSDIATIEPHERDSATIKKYGNNGMIITMIATMVKYNKTLGE